MTTDILECLADAAARGVEVTILTNDRPFPPLRLKWTFDPKWWGGTARTQAAGFLLIVSDLDGDASEWEMQHISRPRRMIVGGRRHSYSPYYHFDHCMLDAEEMLFRLVSARISELRSVQNK